MVCLKNLKKEKLKLKKKERFNKLIEELQSSLLDEMFGLQNNSEEVEITDEELREIEKWCEESFDNNDEQEKSDGFGR